MTITTGSMTGEEITAARYKLGAKWGLDRPLTALEMARALGLSPTNGDDHVTNMEGGRSKVSGPIAILVRLYLDGAEPPPECEVIIDGVSDYEAKKRAQAQKRAAA